MGLFDRLLGTRSSSVNVTGTPKPEKNVKEEAFYLDADSSSSLGDVNFMRRSNKIRHTFPGNVDSPGEKEMVQEVASMEARLEAMSPGLAGKTTAEAEDVDLTMGIPKIVKKTFAEKMSSADLKQRLKGSALMGTNAPGAAAAAKKPGADASAQPGITQQSAKPGDRDPFRSMARDIIS
jgi:hypothetical protein